jgi:hypothetical protein
MMDPDFAGKLSADVGAEDADTDFSFGMAEPGAEEKQKVSDALETATEFSFGDNENQIPLLDPSHFSPFAENSLASKKQRPFLQMPKQVTKPESRVPQVSRPGQDAESAALPSSEENQEAFRTPGTHPLPHRPHRLHQGPRS